MIHALSQRYAEGLLKNNSCWVSLLLNTPQELIFWEQNVTGKEKHVKFPKVKAYVTNERIKFQGLTAKQLSNDLRGNFSKT